MSRIIRVLALLTSCISAGLPQSTPANLQREIASRHQDWSQANAVLVEAVRRLEPCSPRLSILLTEARDSAAALAKANRQYFDQYGAALRKDIASAQKMASESEAELNESKVLEEPANQYAPRVESMRRRTGPESPAPSADTAVSIDGASELAQLRSSLEHRQTLVDQIAGGADSEFKLWTAYYNSIESAASIRCRALQPGAAKPAVRRNRP